MDFRMRISSAIASRNEEPRELKHLSIGRKRKRNAMSSLTASERDTAQTESARTCGVRAIIHQPTIFTKSLGTERDTG